MAAACPAGVSSKLCLPNGRKSRKMRADCHQRRAHCVFVEGIPLGQSLPPDDADDFIQHNRCAASEFVLLVLRAPSETQDLRFMQPVDVVLVGLPLSQGSPEKFECACEAGQRPLKRCVFSSPGQPPGNWPDVFDGFSVLGALSEPAGLFLLATSQHGFLGGSDCPASFGGHCRERRIGWERDVFSQIRGVLCPGVLGRVTMPGGQGFREQPRVFLFDMLAKFFGQVGVAANFSLKLFLAPRALAVRPLNPSPNDPLLAQVAELLGLHETGHGVGGLSGVTGIAVGRGPLEPFTEDALGQQEQGMPGKKLVDVSCVEGLTLIGSGWSGLREYLGPDDVATGFSQNYNRLSSRATH